MLRPASSPLYQRLGDEPHEGRFITGNSDGHMQGDQRHRPACLCVDLDEVFGRRDQKVHLMGFGARGNAPQIA